MLGGSASSQTSGAPFRTESDTNRGTVWPSPAHQTDLFNRGYEIYSLFPGAAEGAKGLYGPAVKAMHPTNYFQGFRGTQKVPDAFFSTKFTFSSNRTSEFESVPNVVIGSSTKPSTPVGDITTGKESRVNGKSVSNDVVVVKSEADEVNKIQCTDVVDDDCVRSDRGDGSREDLEKRQNGTQQIVTTVQVGQANEPDSTDSRLSQDSQKNEDITSSEVDGTDKSIIDSGSEVKNGNERPNSESKDPGDDSVGKEKINLIDLSGEWCGKGDGHGKTDSNERKCPKPKVPDSSSTGQMVNCRQFNRETSKSSPNRTLPVSPNNGGCSRTTPVTLRHPSKGQTGNGNTDVSSVSIKREPMEFQKYPSGSPFLGFTPLDNLFNPALRVLDSQILNAAPYPDSYESYNRTKDAYLSPGLGRTEYLSSGFPSTRPLLAETPFLSPKLDLGEFNNYKNCRTMMGSHLTNMESSSETCLGPRVCTPKEDNRNGPEVTSQVNSTSESEKNSHNTNGSANVTPCQVAEVTSASALLSPKIPVVSPVAVKQETASGTSGTSSSVGDQKKDVSFTPSGQSTAVSSTVGVSLTSQRCQTRHEDIKMSLAADSPPSVLHQRVHSPASLNVSPAMGAAVYSGGIVYNDRPPSIWPSQPHNPGLWQYSAPVDYPPFPPVGFQLVRDPITEALQRAILWPNYQPTHSQMIIPPISLQPNSPRLLLETNVSPVDFLTPETIQRHTSQHRILINTCNRKVMGPALIKFEASEDSNTLAVPTMENGGVCTKSQAVALAAGKTLGSFNHVTSGLPENIGSQEASTVSCLSPVVQKPQDQFQPIGSTVLSNPSYTSGPLTGAGNQSTPAVEMKNDGSQTSIAHENKFEVFGRRTDVTSSREEDKETEEVPLRGEPEDDKRAVLREIQKRREMEENLKVKISLVPDVNIKKEMVSPSQVDLSGLELLSNSIEQLMCETKDKKIVVDYIESVDKSVIDVDRKDLFNDACEGAVLLQNLKNGFRTLDNSPYKEDESRKDLGGLGLLCALAEQRFQEEIGKANSKNKEAILDCKDADSYEEAKEDGGDSYKDEDEKQTDVDFRTSCMKEETKDCDFNRNYHNECEYSLKDCDDDVETADDADCEDSEKESQSSKHKTTRRYEESENSFSGRGPGRPKKTKCKKLISSPVHRTSRKSKEMSPPVLEKQTDYPPVDEGDDSEEDPLQSKYKIDVLKPPTLTPSAVLEPSSAPAVRPVPWERLGQDSPRRTIKSETSPGGSESSRKRKYSDSDDMDSLSLSKRRKVGRPKKHIPVGGTRNAQTETIVIKKPRTKPNYLFHPVQTDGEGSDEEHPTREKRKSPFEKFEDQTDDGTNEDKRKNKTKKIRPKLKAEPKIREWTPASDDINLMDWCKSVADEEEDDVDDDEEEEEDVEESTGRKVRVQKKEEDSKISTEATATNKMKVESKLQSCVLTVDHIKGDNLPMRTLTEMGGLFYAGQLSAIRAPDVYGITIDGERGNRPHIYSREEILKYSILEVRPTVAADLTPGVRCCAYWSEQYRCLYPGTVSAPASPDPELDERFVNVEFDDGDSGRINIEDIRLLPEDYPIVEYDPNPLQSLTKRRRRTSGTSVESHSKERKSIDSMADTEKVDSVARNPPETPNDETKVHKTNGTPETVTFSNSEADRKHLKKRRRDKLKRLQSLAADGKRKHKKHRCSDEHRHHKHHKKHRKHRHKHGMKRDGDVSGVKRELEENGKVEELKNKKVKKKGVKQSGKSPTRKPKKCKERTDSVESKSKIAAFLPARQLWGWSGKGFKRPGAKGRARKEFYKTIQRGKERITVGDCAVFLSTGRPDRPYIGRIESMWESWGTNMIVKVKWFYHPEETVGCPATLEYPGGLFESPHVDENDVQTISHKCEVLPLKEYTAKLGNSPHRYETIYDNNDIYYLAGYYDPTNTTLKMEPGVK